MSITTQTNSAGVFSRPIISCGSLFINGVPFSEYIQDIQTEDQLDDQEVQEIQAFLARLDISGLTGNLVINDLNRNSVLLTAIQALQNKTNLLDTSGLTQTWTIVDNNRNSVLKSSLDSVQNKTNLLDTSGLTQTWTVVDNNRNSVLKSSLDSQAGDISALQTKTQYISSSSNTITINANTINLNGGVYTNNATFPSLTVSSSLTWAQLGALIATTNIPSWVVSQILTSGIPNFVYSDLWAQKANIVGVKDGSVETTKTAKISNYSLYNTDLNIANLFPVENTFIASGSSSKTILNGSIKQQVFNGDIVIRNNNLTNMNLVDWTLTEADDAVNALYIKGNNMGLHMGAGSQGSSLNFFNSVGGDIVFNTGGTNGLKSSTQPSLRIKYANNFLEQIQMGFIDTNVWNPSSIGAKLFVSQLYNQGAGIVVGSPDVYPATNHKYSYYNSTHANTGALILQDGYSGTTNKAIYTQEAGQKLFYSGQQIYPPLPQATSGGVGITYLIQATSGNAPQTLTMSEVYLSQPSQSITLSTYSNNTNYLLATVRGAIPSAGNPVISGVIQHEQWATYTANQTGQIWDVVNFRATSTQNATYNHPSLGNTTFTNVLRFVYPKTNTSTISNPAGPVFTSFIPVCNNSATLTVHTITIPYIALSATGGNYFVGLEIVNAIGNTIHTFANQPYNNAQTNTINFGGSLTTINITNTTAWRFKFTNLGLGTTNYIQTADSGAQGNNGLMYIIHGSASQVYSTLLYDGVNNKTTLTNNSTGNYIITIPLTTMSIVQLYEPNIEIETRFIQPSGTTTNHSVALLYNDGYLSHVDSTFSTTTATPTIQQVLSAGNNAGNLNIESLGTISPSAITGWNVKEITVSGNLSRTITSGSYAIANTAPVQNITTSGNLGLSIANNTANLTNTAPVQNITTSGNLGLSIANNTANLSNTAPVQNITAGSGISVSVANNNATITNTGITSVVAGNGLVVETIGGTATVSQSIFTALGSLNDPAITETTLRPNKLPQYYGQRWKEQTQIPQATYYDVFVSKDGQTIAVVGSTAISGGETIKVSHDYGATFDNVLNTSPAYVYNAICGSSTGYIMYAISTNPKKIVKSTDFGYTFTAMADPFNLDFPNSAPAGISCSSDGKFVMISDARANGFGKVYSSGDFGANWNTYNIVNNTAYSSTSCMSANGQVRYIILQTNNNLSLAGVYRTNNYGSTWEKRLSKVNVNDTEYGDICCDATGRIVVVSRVFGSNSLYTMVSQDYGSTWFSTGIADIYSVSISPNSSIIWAGAHNGKLYYSNDQGWNFKLLDNLVGSTPHANIATNGDGSIVFSTFYGNSTTRPYAHIIHPIEDLAQKHYFCFTQNLLQASGSSTFYNLPNDMDLQNFEYYFTIDIDKVWYNKFIYLGLNGSQNLAHQYNATYYSSSSTNSPQTLSGTQWNTLTSGANQIYQASDSGQLPIWFSPNSGTFYFASSSLVFRMYSPKKDQIILEKQGHTHYRTYNVSGYDGKGTANSLNNGVGIDYTTIRGQIDYTTAKIYLETNTRWAPSSIQFYYTSDTNVAGNATVKISDITRKAKNKITY